MNHNKTGAAKPSVARERLVTPSEQLSGIFRQTEYAAARLAVLRERASEELLEDTVVLEAFQELDSAHEELRVAEEHLQTQADAIVFAQDVLDLERRRYQELFQAAPEPYLVTDLHGAIDQANLRAAQLLNIDGSFLIGKPLLAFIDSDDRGRFTELLKVVVRQDHVLRSDLRIQPRHWPELMCVTISVSRSLDASGQPCALRWIMREAVAVSDRESGDVERENALEAQLRKRTQELADSKYLLDHCLLREQETERRAQTEARNKDLLLAAVAHELRNPLSSISGWLDMISSATSDNNGHNGHDGQTRAMCSIARSLPVLTRSVEDLLDYARFGDGALKLELSDIDLSLPLHDALEACRPAALSKHVHLVAEIQSGIPAIQADAERLQQVFFHLIGNALKFTPEGGEISVSLRRDGQQAEVVLRDNGMGIDPELLPSVFGAVSQFRKNLPTSAGSLGLGLQLARRLVELHGGTIVAESDGPGCGTTVRLRFALA
jgi:signal transduction histidine kinase